MVKQIINDLEKQFGIAPKIFDGYEFIIGNNKIFIMTKPVQEFQKISSRKGILFARKMGDKIIYSNNAIQIFGRNAKKNIIEMDLFQVKELLQNGKVGYKNNEQYEENTQFIIFYKTFPVGIGVYKNNLIKII